jgi:anti-anti-sigma factor
VSSVTLTLRFIQPIQPLGPDPALLLQQEDASMFSAELSTHEGDDHVVIALRGELDMADAASIAATLTEIAARGPTIIVNLEAVDFMDFSGMAALARGRRQAGRPEGTWCWRRPSSPRGNVE